MKRLVETQENVLKYIGEHGKAKGCSALTIGSMVGNKPYYSASAWGSNNCKALVRKKYLTQCQETKTYFITPLGIQYLYLIGGEKCSSCGHWEFKEKSGGGEKWENY